MGRTKQLLIAPPAPAKHSAGKLSLGGIGYGSAPLNPELTTYFLSGLAALGQALLLNPQPLQPRFKVDSKFSEKANSDLSLANLLQVVEASASEFADNLGLTWEFELSLPEDPELPRWERIVLRIKPNGTSFKDAMKLWDKIDLKVRGALKERTAPVSGKMMELLRRFFIEMDLSE